MRVPFLIGLLIVAAAGGAFMQLKITRYEGERKYIPPEQKGAVSRPEMPPVDRLRAPHALLVLDVSGSMKTSDHDHKQSAAVTRFYEVFQGLSRETLAQSETPKVAVILFSTVAQVIDWNGQNQAWLDVTPENAKLFGQMVETYLGIGANEPRKGQDTDYIAALDEAGRLIDGLPSPPLVLFMTDGLFEPNPLFSTHVTAEQKLKLAPAIYQAKQPQIEEVAKGSKRFLSLRSAEPVFDPRTLGVHEVKPTPDLNRELSDMVPESVQTLAGRTFYLSRREPSACFFWAPLYLAEAPGLNLEAAVSSLLAPPTACRTWGGQTHFIPVRNPRELPGDFVGLLSSWFRLLELPISPGSTKVDVPAQVQAFAIYVETDHAGSKFELAQGNSVTALSGQNDQWAGVANQGGEWTFRDDGGPVRAGKVYYRLRHEWALLTPTSWYQGEGEADLKIDLMLMSIETEKPVQAASVYTNLPDSLPATLRSLAGGAPQPVILRKDSHAGEVAYSVRIPTRDLPSGRAEILVDLSGLKSAGIPLSRELLTETLEIRPSVRVRVRTADGHPATLGVEGLPRETGKLEKLWERVHGK